MDNPIKRLAVLGCTGSIGRQTLDVVSSLTDRFRIIALAAGDNTTLLTEQISKFKPKFVSWRANAIPPTGEYGMLSPSEIAAHPDVDIVVMALPGNVGLELMLAAVRAGKHIALANKESLVSAGEIIMAEAKASGARITPVDSEHSAVWQCLNGEVSWPVRLILTASGGPFRGYSRAQLDEVTFEQSLDHPTWRMGKKVTIDSATLMNKGLEIIEAHWLFNISFEDIDVIVHPQSIIHSMVEFADGSVKAQLSRPDMRRPLQYALSYPERLSGTGLYHIDWRELSRLDFEPPDLDAFPCLRLARQAGEKGSSYPAVLCAADDAAVELFLSGDIKFNDIPRLVECVLQKHKALSHPGIDEITAASAWARAQTLKAAGDNQC